MAEQIDFDPSGAQPVGGSERIDFSPEGATPAKEVGGLESAGRHFGIQAGRFGRFALKTTGALVGAVEKAYSNILGNNNAEGDAYTPLAQGMIEMGDRINEANQKEYGLKPNEVLTESKLSNLGFGGKVGEFAGSVAPHLMTLGALTPGIEGQERYEELEKRGATAEQALKGAATTGAVSVASNLIPMGVGKTVAGKLGAGKVVKTLAGAAGGAAINAPVEAGGAALENLTVPEGEQFEDLKKETKPTAGGTAMGALFGALHAPNAGAGAGKAKPKKTEQSFQEAAQQNDFKPAGEGEYKTPSGDTITPEQWENASDRVRKGWTAKPAEEATATTPEAPETKPEFSPRAVELARLREKATNPEVIKHIDKQIEVEHQKQADIKQGEEFANLAKETDDPALRDELSKKAAKLGYEETAPEGHEELYKAAKETEVPTIGKEPEAIAKEVDAAQHENWKQQHDLSDQEAAQAERIHEAMQIDEGAVERAAIRHEDDEPAFHKEIERIVNERPNEKTPTGGKGETEQIRGEPGQNAVPGSEVEGGGSNAVRNEQGTESAVAGAGVESAPGGHERRAGRDGVPGTVRRPFRNVEESHRRTVMQRAKEAGAALTEEQAGQIAPIKRDVVTGFHTADQRIPTIERARIHAEKTGEPAHYVEADISNLGGLNKKFGHSGADEHFKAMSEIFAEEMRKTGGDVELTRHGGDEISAIVVNADRAKVEQAGARAKARTLEYAKENGLSELEHPKHPGNKEHAGTGINFGVSEINKRPTKEILSEADKRVEQEKLKGKSNVIGEKTEAPRPVAPEGQAGGVKERAGQTAKAGREEVGKPETKTAEETAAKGGEKVTKESPPLTKEAANRLAKTFTAQGTPTKAVPHPTKKGMFTLEEDEGAKLKLESTQKSADDLRDSLGLKDLEIEVKSPEEVEKGPRGFEFRAARRLGERFGKDVIYVKQSKPLFAGAHNEGKIFLSVDTKHPVMQIYGHELLHAMRNDSPKLYDQLRDLIRPLMKDKQKYFDDLNEQRAKQGLKPLKADRLEEEFIADITGDRFKEPAFYRELAKQDLPAFKRVAANIVDWIKDTIAKLKGKSTSARYIHDLRAAQKAIGETLAQYGKIERQAIKATEPRLSVEKEKRSDISPLGFYSALSRGIEKATSKMQPAAGWSSFIKGLTTKGVKPDEIEWSGVNDWLKLQGAKVSKEDVLGYLKNNGVKVEEKTLSGGKDRLMAGAFGEPSPTKFHEYQLPGGSNYRELLLTLPESGTTTTEGRELRDIQQRIIDGKEKPGDANRLAELKEKSLGTKFRSSHFDEPNILAHIRMNDRADANGKKVLFLEELQGDWGQQGKKKGISLSSDDYKKEQDRIERLSQEALDKGDKAELSRLHKEWNELHDAQDSGVHNAPFIGKTGAWTSLALKRVIDYAAKNGYDKVAWTNGEQQAERYDLSKQIDKISWVKQNDGRYDLSIWKKGAKHPEWQYAKDDAKLADTIGKELAEKIINDKKTGGSFEGLDLKVGGEGMKAYYDKIVPNTANDVLKKIGGGRVGEMNITGPKTADELAAMVYGKGETYKNLPSESKRKIDDMLNNQLGKQPGFDITPEMRDRVTEEGQPMFSLENKKQTETPEFKRWFGDSKVVDENGKPLIVYHGTNQDIRAFNETRHGQNTASKSSIAFFFTEHPGEANEYAQLAGRTQIADAVSTEKKSAQLMKKIEAAEKRGDFDTSERLTHELESLELGAINADPSGQNIIPAYLNLRKIKSVDMKDGFDGHAVAREIIAAKKAGFDGIKLENVFDPVSLSDREGNFSTTQWIVFDKKNIKSSIGNKGTFDPNNPDISLSLESKKPELEKESKGIGTGHISSKARNVVSSVMEYINRGFYDNLEQLHKHQKDLGKTISDAANAYDMEIVSHGRKRERLKDLVENYVDPIQEIAAKEKLTQQDVSDYLYAKHAPEANKYIETIREGFKDGSGISDKAANGIIDSFSPEQKTALEKISSIVQTMRKESLDKRVEDGLISDETRKELLERFPNWVSLKNFSDDSIIGGSKVGGTGPGLEVTGKEFKARSGRVSKAEDPLSMTINDAMMAIVRAESNRVAQAVHQLVKENPTDAWEKVTEENYPKRKERNAEGKVVEVKDPTALMHDPHYFGAKINGQQEWIKIKSDKLARQLSRMGQAGFPDNAFGDVMKGVNFVTHTLARAKTQLNPEFTAMNVMRDMQEAALNTTAFSKEKGAKLAAATIKNLPSSLKASAKVNMGELFGKKFSDEDAKLYKQASLDGAFTSGYGLMSARDIQNTVKRAIDAASGKKLAKIIVTAEKAFKPIEKINDSFENMTRFAVYKAALDAGFTRQQAAVMGKKATLNFDKRGEASPYANAIWAFFNAGCQGTKAFFVGLRDSNYVRAAAAAMFAAGLAEPWTGDEDEIGTNKKDVASEFKRDRGLTYLLGNHVLFYPIAQGLTIPYMAGRHISRALQNRQSVADAVGDILGGMWNTYFPVNTLAPTVIAPLTEASNNKDFANRKIAKQSEFDTSKPASSQYRENANAAFVAFAKGLNELGGGTETKKSPIGFMDLSPEKMQYVFKQYLGGLALPFEVANMAASDKEMKIEDYPGVRRFVLGEKEDYRHNQAAKVVREANRRHDDIRSGEEVPGDEIGHVDSIRSMESDIRALTKDRNLAKKAGNDTSSIDERLDELYKRVITSDNEFKKAQR